MEESVSMKGTPFPASLEGRLIVSCQAAPGDPLHHVDTLARMAASAIRGGTAGLRANGSDSIAAFRQVTTLPIIGIEKKRFGNDVSITPDFPTARAIANAGADVIAIDCTVARHPLAQPWPELIARIHSELALPVLADIATEDEALAAESAGADAVATTLYGFTPQTAGARSVNWELVGNLAGSLRIPLIVEGHISHPQEARRALDLGAFAVVVGSAITSPQSIAARFAEAICQSRTMQSGHPDKV